VCTASRLTQQELFSTCGTIHSVKVFYDKSGRSEGKGEVIYKLNGDAERAVRVCILLRH
jgi:hypothetical protein